MVWTAFPFTPKTSRQLQLAMFVNIVDGRDKHSNQGVAFHLFTSPRRHLFLLAKNEWTNLTLAYSNSFVNKLTISLPVESGVASLAMLIAIFIGVSQSTATMLDNYFFC